MSDSMKSQSFDVSSFVRGEKPIDLHEGDVSPNAKKITINHGGGTSELDVSVWLPKAAEMYGISKNIRDYIVVPVPVNISELPNTNGDAFSKAEWLRFNPEQGRLAFQTFTGKPTFVEHQNNDYTKAAGVILDNHLAPLRGFRGEHVRLTLLLAFDRLRYPTAVRNILAGMNTYSKGTTYKAYRCSICGHITTAKKKNYCKHTYFNKPTYIDPETGRLAYRDCLLLTGFECSSVADPAFACAAAYQDHTMVLR